MLLEALGEVRAVPLHAGDESIACSGCDICNGTALLYPQDERELITFVAANKRKFTAPQLIRILHENLPLWRAGDISSLVSQLIQERKIRPANALFWKGALVWG